MNQRSGMSAVLWLARREITRLWFSYLGTVAVMLFMGFLAASAMEAGALGPAETFDRRTAVFADIVILLLATLLATNYTFWGSYSDWTNPSERRLAFIRSLPIPASTIVGSRMASLIFPLPFTVPAFFLPIYLLSDIEMGIGSYLAFALFWVGYALIWAGFNLYAELVRGSKFFFWISFVLVPVMIGLILIVNLAFDFQIVSEVARLATDAGLLMATVSVVVGVAAFLLLGRRAERGLLEREIPV